MARQDSHRLDKNRLNSALQIPLEGRNQSYPTYFHYYINRNYGQNPVSSLVKTFSIHQDEIPQRDSRVSGLINLGSIYPTGKKY